MRQRWLRATSPGLRVSEGEQPQVGHVRVVWCVIAGQADVRADQSIYLADQLCELAGRDPQCVGVVCLSGAPVARLSVMTREGPPGDLLITRERQLIYR